MKKRGLAILMVLVMLFALPGCSTLDGFLDDGSTVLRPFPDDIGTRAFEDIDYVHFDMDYFRSYVDETERMIKEGETDTEELGYRVDQITGSYVELMDMRTIAEVYGNLDLTDDYWSGEVEYIDEITNEICQRVGNFLLKVLELDNADAIAKEAGFDDDNHMRSDAEYYLSDDTNPEESKIINQYYKLMYDCESDPDDAQAKQLTELLIKLVKFRNEQARKIGYNNYAEMMYAGRSVSLKEAENFEDMLKTVAKEYPELVSYDFSSLSYESDFDFYSPKEVKACMRDYLPQIDEKLGDAFDRLDKRGMFILTDGDKANDTGYTMSLYIPNTPIVYNYSERSFRGITDGFHEFGHAYAAMVTNEGNGDYGEWMGEISLSEIQSSGLEALLFDKYDEIYGEAADEARLYMSEFFLDGIIGSAADDSFERALYTTPNLTPEKVCKLYEKSRKDYGKYSDSNYDFLQISHYFDNPIYQAHYMLAYYATAQLLLQAEKDFDKASANYMKAAACGDNGNVSYVELLDEMGLCNVDDMKAARSVVADFCKYVNKLYKGGTI